MATEPSDTDLILDRRLTILETRFDTILPTLATKADLAELRLATKADIAELRGEFLAKLAETKLELKAETARLTKWMASMFITMVLGFGGMALTMMSLLRH
jgi:hypothetical protein